MKGYTNNELISSLIGVPSDVLDKIDEAKLSIASHEVFQQEIEHSNAGKPYDYLLNLFPYGKLEIHRVKSKLTCRFIPNRPFIDLLRSTIIDNKNLLLSKVEKGLVDKFIKNYEEM